MPNHGRIEHIEFPADDVERAKAFYSAVFGWSFREMPGMADYFLFDPQSGPGGSAGGAVGKRNVSTAGVTRLYVTVDSIDGALVATTANGGRVVEPKAEITGLGWWAVVADSEGNELGLYESSAGA